MRIVAYCGCACHRPPDDAPPPYGVVELLDPIERHAACSACRNEHWRAFYEATEPRPRVAREKTKWIDAA